MISMKRYSTSWKVVLPRVVACLAICAVVTSCGDDDDSSATTIAADTDTADTDANTTAEVTTAGAASGDACADREALRSSVAALTDVDVVAEGTNGLTAAVDAVKSDLEKVRGSAGSEVEPQVQAVQDAIAATEAGVDNLGDGGAAEVAAALSTLSTATTTLLASLEGGPCG
jgi:hypothetical protein